MTQLTPTLYAVEVPSDATEIKIGSLNMGIYFYVNERIDCVNLGFNLKGNFKILGEVTKDEISFDVKKLPEISLTIKEADLLLNENDEVDFIKLLQYKGIYFENPLGSYEEALKRHIVSGNWQISQDKVIKGKLIILEKL